MQLNIGRFTLITCTLIIGASIVLASYFSH